MDNKYRELELENVRLMNENKRLLELLNIALKDMRGECKYCIDSTEYNSRGCNYCAANCIEDCERMWEWVHKDIDSELYSKIISYK